MSNRVNCKGLETDMLWDLANIYEDFEELPEQKKTKRVRRPRK